MEYARALIVGEIGAWGVVEVYMGMTVGCSASSPPLGKIQPRIIILITMETVVVDGLVIGRSGSDGAIQVLQGVSGVVYMQREQTQTTLGNTMVSAHKVSIM